MGGPSARSGSGPTGSGGAGHTSPPGGDRAESTPRPRSREWWEALWERHPDADFFFAIDEPPPQLVDAVALDDLPPGGALDVGSGSGVVTAFLAGSFRPAVGVDVSMGAARAAGGLAAARLAPARFVVAGAPGLPFRAASFALVFERGCLQNIPLRDWRSYMDEVARVLVPGGAFHLFYSVRLPRPASLRGIRARVAVTLRRRPPGKLGRRRLRRLLPPRLRLVRATPVSSQLASGAIRPFTWVECRRDPAEGDR